MQSELSVRYFGHFFEERRTNAAALKKRVYHDRDRCAVRSARVFVEQDHGDTRYLSILFRRKTVSAAGERIDKISRNVAAFTGESEDIFPDAVLSPDCGKRFRVFSFCGPDDQGVPPQRFDFFSSIIFYLKTGQSTQ